MESQMLTMSFFVKRILAAKDLVELTKAVGASCQFAMARMGVASEMAIKNSTLLSIKAKLAPAELLIKSI